MNLNLSTAVKQKVGSAIVISGSGRSGTTIIGKLLHSFEDVEYAFEPPALVTLMPLIEQMGADAWRLIYETYLYEDFFISALAGRAINTNRRDDSSIYQVKTVEEIEARLTQSHRKTYSEKVAESHLIAYKLPNVVPFLPKLLEYYPNTKVLIMKRDAIGTINSLMDKEWFSDENVRNSTVWPYRDYQGVHVPSWVATNDDQKWVELSEVDRCAYYYIRVNEGVDKIPNRVELSYQQLLSEPQKTAEMLADAFSLKLGAKTPEIIQSIAPAEKERDLDILAKISPSLVEQVVHYSNQSS